MTTQAIPRPAILSQRQSAHYEMLESWIQGAPAEDILRYLAALHGGKLEAGDLDTIPCGRWYRSRGDKWGAAHHCEKCNDFVLAWMTIGLGPRPELKTLRPALGSRALPMTYEQVMRQHRVDLESWVEKAPVKDILDHLVNLHGMLDLDDLKSVECGRWRSAEEGAASPGAHSCDCCSDVVSTMVVVALTKRPELQALRPELDA
ncbi:hypothetical protein RMI87_30170 [Pseudomonas aeruginosa]|uniref:hypothetical protein n=1 Tax=Pseudomonas aeruginosa TaxID=287 RepID=UPI00287C80BE|nr:hypothetical protein [Pseudomonas aeruginosa]MDS9917774.1 hypothetical protein [Pseudomonas aeruginosa]